MAKQATCHTCVYAHWDAGLWMRTLWSGFAAWPTCGNQPDSPGRMRECPRGGVCRNYRVRPPVPQGDGVKTIPLGDGVYAYVDAVDYEWLNQWHWRVHGGYAARHENRNGKRKVVFMHREIMKPPPGKIVDHANGNKLDNTRANLRNITSQENQHNRRKQRGASSIYKGVTYYKAGRCWRARVDLGKESFYLGQFDSEVEAARAYDYKAVELFGEFARPNFPDQWPAERRREVHAKWLRERARAKKGSRQKGAGRARD
jgi:hypothetical protein